MSVMSAASFQSTDRRGVGNVDRVGTGGNFGGSGSIRVPLHPLHLGLMFLVATPLLPGSSSTVLIPREKLLGYPVCKDAKVEDAKDNHQDPH